MSKKIAVLMGGWGSEREVSLSSGEGVYSALIKLGYDAVKLDFDRDVAAKLQKIMELLAKMVEFRVCLIF